LVRSKGHKGPVKEGLGASVWEGPEHKYHSFNTISCNVTAAQLAALLVQFKTERQSL